MTTYDEGKLKELISEYEALLPKRWAEDGEYYKWEAIEHFQSNWNINAEDFGKMFKEATSKTGNLLSSAMFFPRKMIDEFCKVDQEYVREMFIGLYDETRDFVTRVLEFIGKVKTFKETHDPGNWKNHFQNTNSISTYLWLRYPDRYYIYKYSETKRLAQALDCNLNFTQGHHEDNLRKSMELYDSIRSELQRNDNLESFLEKNAVNEYYRDPKMVTLTIDFGYYVGTVIGEGAQIVDYHPEISVEQWMDLLENREVFTENSRIIMAALKDYGGEATCKQLSLKYGRSPNFYNGGSSSLAERVHKKTNCPLFLGDQENSKWWPILFTGRRVGKDVDGTFSWKLRDELSEALDRVDLSDVQLYADDDKDTIIKPEQYGKVDFLNDVFMSDSDYDTLASLLLHKKNVILQGAPGVGKTFCAKRLAYSIMGVKDETRIEFIQFHQNYSYEDMVMGYRPYEDGFVLNEGVFHRFCQKARENPESEFFFIIDEINRGNLSKIFGELLMLIENDHRDEEITLAYNGETFSVPGNVYIIGMMNTADRSLAMIDYALRRRFSFFDMSPGFITEGFSRYKEALGNGIFDSLVERIKELNKEIAEDDSLGKGFCIGHSYLCDFEGTDVELRVKEVVEYDIIPMLSEYWFDDGEKLRFWSNKLQGVYNG